MAPLFRMIPVEPDAALQQLFGATLSPRHYPVFGIGIGHAFGRPDFVSRYVQEHLTAAGLLVEALDRPTAERRLARVCEEEWLAGPPTDLPAGGLNIPIYRQATQAYVDREQAIIGLFEQCGASAWRRAQALAYLLMACYGGLVEEATARAGITTQDLLDLSFGEFMSFLAAMPSRHVDYELHRMRYKNRFLRRTTNDMDDIDALSMAVAYCDVVVTEKLWAGLLGQSKIHRVYNAVILHDVRDLGPVLAGAS
jgi:hypothetical protein